jgi:transposase
MNPMVPPLRYSAKQKLLRHLRQCRCPHLKIHYLIILNLVAGRSAVVTAEVLKVARSTVYAMAQRFRTAGELGLVDRREENGQRKLDERYLATLYEVVRSNPPEHGWKRPTWTRELLVETVRRQTGTRIHVATMSVALRRIDARRGRPKPTVGCPWSRPAKTRRLRALAALVEQLPPDEVAVWEDEVDIHLNPKIGLDWMVRGQQKEVPTPGKNVKRYLAGAQDVRTGELLWVEGEKKNSLLFIRLLWELVQHYKDAKVIHVILDNFSIHDTLQVWVSLATEQGRRLRLHFLPPYCPDDNRIERTWEDLHGNVTRNHQCASMEQLMRNVRSWLHRRNRKLRMKGKRWAA